MFTIYSFINIIFSFLLPITLFSSLVIYIIGNIYENTLLNRFNVENEQEELQDILLEHFYRETQSILYSNNSRPLETSTRTLSKEVSSWLNPTLPDIFSEDTSIKLYSYRLSRVSTVYSRSKLFENSYSFGEGTYINYIKSIPITSDRYSYVSGVIST